MVALLVLPVFALTFTACGGKEVKKQVGLTDEEKARLEAERLAREKARMEEEARMRALELEKQRLAAAREAFENELVHFEFNKSDILPEYEAVLARKAEYMKALANIMVKVEGHCDERGTEAYNLALGDRRAKAAKGFLETNYGIAGSRMETESYGESMPLDPAHTEEAWAKNRRAAFKIISE